MTDQLQKQREKSFKLVYEVIHDNFPFKTKKERFDFIKNYKKEYKRIFEIKKDDRFFFLFLEEFLAKLKNAHTRLNDYPTKKFFKPKDLDVQMLQDKFFLIRKKNILGEIISIDGLTPTQLLKECSKRISASTRQYLIYKSLMFLLTDQFGRKIKIVINQNNKKFVLTIERVPIKNKSLEKLVEFKTIKADIGYLQIKTWTDRKVISYIDKAINFFKKKKIKSLIIDVRNNGGGDSRIAGYLAGHFFNKKILFCKTKTRISGQELRYKKRTFYVLPREPYLDVQVVLLINEACLSSNEYFIAGTKDNKRAYLIGEKTGGSSGNPKMFKIPYKNKFFELLVSTWIYFRPNGQILEGFGIKPHLQVSPSLKDFKNNKDVILEKAKSLAVNFRYISHVNYLNNRRKNLLKNV